MLIFIFPISILFQNGKVNLFSQVEIDKCSKIYYKFTANIAFSKQLYIMRLLNSIKNLKEEWPIQ